MRSKPKTAETPLKTSVGLDEALRRAMLVKSPAGKKRQPKSKP